MKATWNNTVIAESDDTVLVECKHYCPERIPTSRPLVHVSN
jgi:hypothetical protein